MEKENLIVYNKNSFKKNLKEKFISILELI